MAILSPLSQRHVLSSWLFVRLLGLVYLCAFVSLGVQVVGLIGHDGILPAQAYLKAIAAELGGPRPLLLPTLCWLGAGDGVLRLLCWGGAGLSVLLIAGVAPVPLLLLLWAFYLSLVSVGQEFLGYQWDALLLETGFLALFLAPPRLLAVRPGHRPAWLARFLLVFLLFRLMFSSGSVKLLSHDPAWRSLDAVDYHFWTQPLPAWPAWWAQQLSHWTRRAMCALMFAIELGVPFLFFSPWAGPRRAGAALTIVLMGGIALTGNYGFFNLLTVALCLLLLDDALLARALPQRWRPDEGTAPRPTPAARVQGVATAVYAVAWLGCSALLLLGMAEGRRNLPGPARTALRAVGAFQLVNPYGLFAVMTTTRQEIVVEGSDDGHTWLAYDFRYKPGDVDRRPAFVAPHQPRLDWQMWFAALGPREDSPWFSHFALRLLQGSQPVLALLKHNPFPDHPPRYLRARLYDYHFTTIEERRRTGAWWKRSEAGMYLPQVTLR